MGCSGKGVFSGVVLEGGLVNEVEGALAQEPEDLSSNPGFAAVCLCESHRPLKFLKRRKQSPCVWGPKEISPESVCVLQPASSEQ